MRSLYHESTPSTLKTTRFGGDFSQVDGPLFFTSANRLVKLLDPSRDPEEVELRFGEATLMDFTSVETLHKIALNYQNEGVIKPKWGMGMMG